MLTLAGSPAYDPRHGIALHDLHSDRGRCRCHRVRRRGLYPGHHRARDGNGPGADTTTTWLGTFAGDGVQGYVDGAGMSAQIHRRRSMTSDDTSIDWAEQEQLTIRQGTILAQDVSTLVGLRCEWVIPCVCGHVDAMGTSARFDTPFGVTFHYPSNSSFVLDSNNDVIRRIQ